MDGSIGAGRLGLGILVVACVDGVSGVEIWHQVKCEIRRVVASPWKVVVNGDRVLGVATAGVDELELQGVANACVLMDTRNVHIHVDNLRVAGHSWNRGPGHRARDDNWDNASVVVEDWATRDLALALKLVLVEIISLHKIVLADVLDSETMICVVQEQFGAGKR